MALISNIFSRQKAKVIGIVEATNGTQHKVRGDDGVDYLLDSPIEYAVGDRVIAFDGVIFGKTGNKTTSQEYLV